MTNSNASIFPCIDPPSGFALDPGGRIAYGPRSGDVYSIWTPDADVEVVVPEDSTGGHCFAAARELRDDLDAVIEALGILGLTT
ncbi:hypothetical protein [Citricoccus sp. I39-566]|uniref:hypothetical protein n=1 Tax=Citricoccus sp. I39-566 TaxID=3073268 RepID=UPI00286A661C|nr:hypothetical protein [Citricoccus sp. I39-566]WMY79423.1 hypothetical protein RE421_06040 [Citricoccus sp. I39-566]